MKRVSNVVMCSFIFSILYTCTCTTAEYETQKVEISNNVDGFDWKGNYPQVLKPSTVVKTKKKVWSIFSIPVKNSVGTTSYKTDLYQFIFEGNKARFLKFISPIDKDDTKNNQTFMPQFSDHYFAYVDHRGVFIGDTKRKWARKFYPDFSLDRWLEKIECIDESKLCFAVQNVTGMMINQLPGLSNNILVFSIKKNKPQILWQLKNRPAAVVKYYPPWTCYNGMILSYQSSVNMLEVYNGSDGRKITTELADNFNNHPLHSKFRNMQYITVHKKYPFAMIMETGRPFDWDSLMISAEQRGIDTKPMSPFMDSVADERQRNVLWILRWGTNDTALQFRPLSFDSSSVFGAYNPTWYEPYMEFSPDGNWFLIRNEYYDNRHHQKFQYWVIPVDTTKDNFLGTPVFLYGSDNFKFTSTAWIADRLSFVGTTGDTLVRWELEGLNDKQ